MEGTMKHIRALLAALLVVCLAGCGQSTPAPPATPVAPLGQSVPFEVCGESTTWTRPAEAEQKAKQWDSGRYSGLDRAVIRIPWEHAFFVSYGNASGEYDLINLSGLWTLGADVRARCLEPAAQDAVLKLEVAEVWVLLHQVKSVRREGTEYTIVVAPADQGVQFVRFARPEPPSPLTLRFVDERGQALDEIVEAESPYWPYPDLLPTGSP